MEIRPLSFTIRTQPMAALGGQEVAYCDFDGSGSFDPQHDTTVFWQNESGGGLASYAEVRQALTDLGGSATGQQLAEKTGRKDARLEPARVDEPVCNGRFTLEPDGIRADFERLGSVPVIAPEGGEIATLDVNRDGVSEPLHDSMLMLHSSDGHRHFTGTTSFSELKEAVRAAGGRLGEGGLAALAPAPITSLSESPAQYDTMGLHRTLRLDDQGALWLDYST